jgi:hypothetical protein
MGLLSFAQQGQPTQSAPRVAQRGFNAAMRPMQQAAQPQATANPGMPQQAPRQDVQQAPVATATQPIPPAVPAHKPTGYPWGGDIQAVNKMAQQGFRQGQGFFGRMSANPFQSFIRGMK